MQDVPYLSLDAYCFLLTGKCKFTLFPGPDSKRCLEANVNSTRQEESHLTCYPRTLSIFGPSSNNGFPTAEKLFCFPLHFKRAFFFNATQNFKITWHSAEIYSFESLSWNPSLPAAFVSELPTYWAIHALKCPKPSALTSCKFTHFFL